MKTMFYTTYGLSDRRFNGRTALEMKAVNYDSDITVLPIGGIGGEDAPFCGEIYCISTKGIAIPFIVRSKETIGYKNLNEFNHSKYRQNRDVNIPITSLKISHLGSNLKNLKVGPKASIGYKNDFWGDDYHGYTFSCVQEKEKMFKIIQQSLPVLCFDSYTSLTNPTPSFCENIDILEAEIFNRDLSGNIERKSVNLLLNDCIDRYNSNSIVAANGRLLTSEERAEKSKALNRFPFNGPPLKLEEFFFERLNVERIVFTHSEDSYPRNWNEQWLISD